MKFGRWTPIERALSDAPPAPGVLQTRAEALLSYPNGRSAMVSYAASGAGETLAAYVTSDPGAAGLAAAAAAGARYVRFGEGRAPEEELARLLAGFVERFGGPPVATPDREG